MGGFFPAGRNRLVADTNANHPPRQAFQTARAMPWSSCWGWSSGSGQPRKDQRVLTAETKAREVGQRQRSAMKNCERQRARNGSSPNGLYRQLVTKGRCLRFRAGKKACRTSRLYFLQNHHFPYFFLILFFVFFFFLLRMFFEENSLRLLHLAKFYIFLLQPF